MYSRSPEWRGCGPGAPWDSVAVVDFFDVRHARLAFAEAHGTRFHNSRLNVQLDAPPSGDGSQQRQYVALHPWRPLPVPH